MRKAITTLFVALLTCTVGSASWADLAPYSQDFEGLVQADPGALAGDGWLVFGNVFDPAFTHLYGYGPFAAPNGSGAFCDIVAGQGGPAQGTQQLVAYSDYANGDHGAGNWIEANVFQEQVIGAADVGDTWFFTFDAKLGNLGGATTAIAFIKTLDPNAGFALSNFLTVDTTSIPSTWDTYQIAIAIDAGLVGHILQFGFSNTATNYEPSGVFYDNIQFSTTPPVSVEPSSWGQVKSLYR